MKAMTLTNEQKQTLESRHKKCRDKRECDRIKAILLASEGWSTRMISQALRLHETSINRHISEYQSSQKLTISSGGSEGYLTEVEIDELIAHLEDNTYLNSHHIAAYISEKYEVNYTISGLNKWLHQHNFSYKQPKGVPHKFDEEKQSQFIKNYEELKDSLPENEVILFMDATHPTQATKVTQGWIRKGSDKSVETTGSRTRVNIVGAIRLGHLDEAVIKHYPKTVNGDVIMSFLDDVKVKYRDKKTIHMILDGAGYHRSEVVVEKAKELGIKLHYLPPYSPNLNPIERLWKVMNKYVRNNQYFATTKQFKEKLFGFFTDKLPQIAEKLQSTITDNFQRFSSAF